jgi:hypothetical protein
MHVGMHIGIPGGGQGGGGSAAALELVVDTLLASDAAWTPNPPASATAKVEGWGGGGEGLLLTGAGGGGEYRRLNAFAIEPATGYAVVVGAGGTGGTGADGTDTTLQATTLVAKAGKGRLNGGTGGTGGTGDVGFAGGAGAAGAGNTVPGGSAGSTGVGLTGTPGTPNGAAGLSGAAPQTGGSGGASSAADSFDGGPGMFRATYSIASVAGFPRLVGFSEGRDAVNATTRDFTLPTEAVAGDLAILMWAVDGVPTNTVTGWTSKGIAINGASVTLEAFELILDGIDPVTIATSASEQGNWQVWVFRGASGCETATANGSSTNANAPSLSPSGGSKSYSWIAAHAWHASAGLVLSAFPSGYSWRVLTPGEVFTGVALGTSMKQAAAATENPGACTSTTEQWGALTIAVIPT